MIPKEKIEEIREKADIVMIIADYLPLKKRGKNNLALCPFHSEKTPSFTVSGEKQLFHCFGCGEGGNVFAFIMKIENVDFPEAVEIVGEKVGVHVEKDKTDGFAKTHRDRLYDLMSLACNFYQKNLDDKQGAGAREYIVKRKLSDAITKKFKLGYAEDSFNSLLNYLISRGAKLEDIEAAGLALKRQDSAGYYDRFRGRLMFPIFDLRGHVVGFSGRALKNEEPKYLNSPDTFIFNKGGNLFSLNFAKETIKKRKYAILVEGNIDAAMAHDLGFSNTVAPLGTAFTLNQAKLLKRFADTVVIAFDADAAGFAAAERMHEVLSEAELSARILDLGKFKDPDEFLRSEGAEKFTESLKRSMPATEFKIKRIISRFNMAEAEGRARAANEVSGLLAKENNNILQNEYIKFAAGQLKMAEELLASEVRKRDFYKKSFGSSQRNITKRPPEKITEAEKSLIKFAMESGEALNLIKENLSFDDFSDQNYKEIFQKLKEVPPQDLLANLGTEEQKRIVREALISEHSPENIKSAVHDCMNAVKEYRIKKQLEELRHNIIEEEKKANLEAVKKLHSEYSALSEILRSYAR